MGVKIAAAFLLLSVQVVIGFVYSCNEVKYRSFQSISQTRYRIHPTWVIASRSHARTLPVLEVYKDPFHLPNTSHNPLLNFIMDLPYPLSTPLLLEVDPLRCQNCIPPPIQLVPPERRHHYQQEPSPEPDSGFDYVYIGSFATEKAPVNPYPTAPPVHHYQQLPQVEYQPVPQCALNFCQPDQPCNDKKHTPPKLMDIPPAHPIVSGFKAKSLIQPSPPSHKSNKNNHKENFNILSRKQPIDIIRYSPY